MACNSVQNDNATACVLYRKSGKVRIWLVAFVVEEESSLCGAGLGGDEVDVGGARLDVDDLLPGCAAFAEVRRRRWRRRHFQVVVTYACTHRRRLLFTA